MKTRTASGRSCFCAVVRNRSRLELGPVEQSIKQPAPRTAFALLVLASGFVALLGVKELAGIVAPLLLTINLFVAAYPIQLLLMRAHVPRPAAQAALTVVVFLILGLFFFSLVWAVTALVRELPGYQEEFVTLYDELVVLLAGFGITEAWILEQLQTISPANFAGIVQRAIGGVTDFLTAMAIVVTMVFMMAIDGGSFPARGRMLRRHQGSVAESLTNFVTGVRRYWVVSSIFGLIVAVIDVVALMMLGVPLALVWGILSFLTNYIPNVGFLIGVVPPALMALLANGPFNALAVVAVYSAVNLVVQAIIQPKFNGDAVGVTASVSFLSLLLWGYVLGPLGALLGLPMTLLVKALLVDPDPQMRWLNAFLSNDPRTTEFIEPAPVEPSILTELADSDAEVKVEVTVDPPDAEGPA